MASDVIAPAAVQHPLNVLEQSAPRSVRGTISHRRQARLFVWFTWITIIVASAMLLAVDENVRAVLSPAVAMLALTLFYLAVLVKRDGQLPIFEAATFFVLATTIYTVIPLIQFVAIGMEWMSGSDFRLVQWAPTPQQFGGFAWRHVLLLATFVFTYLLVRGKRLWRMNLFVRPTPQMTLAIVTIVLIGSAYLIALDVYVGPTLSLYEGGTGAGYLQLPHVVLQIANVVMIMNLTLKQCLVIVLLIHWSERRWRIVLMSWLVAEFTVTVDAFESRTSTVLLLLTFIVGYHHVVRPIRIRTAFIVGVVMLGGFLAFGLLRDTGVQTLQTDRQTAWGASNEFQVLFGNAYDIYMRKQDGLLPQVPPQLPFADFYRLIPSQILPFYKWEPSIWYKDKVLEWRDTMGFMFGIVTQSVLGYGWVELFARAFLLALFYATAHRVWRRYSGSFWATIAYLFLLTWAYYAFRSSSFEVLYRLVYYLAPAAIGVKLLTLLVSVPVRARQRAQHSS